VLAFPLAGFAQAPYQRSSITTNLLGADLFWDTGTKQLTSTNGFNTGGHVSAAAAVRGAAGQFTNTLTLLFGTANTLLKLDVSNGAASVANGVGVLTNDGSGGFGWSTNIAGGGTNTTNTVVNSTTVNATTVNVTSNTFNVGKGGHLTISSNLTVLQVGPSKLVRTDSGTNLAAVIVGTGLAFDGTTLSSPIPTNFPNAIFTNYVQMPWTTLTMTGSNVSTIDLSAGSAFKLLATNKCFFGAPTGLPGTNLAQSFQIAIQQDSTGARTVMFTNSAWVMNNAGTSTNATPTINTNSSGLTVLSFVTSPFSSTQVYGVSTTIGP
jgi:hypothetical protein